MASTDDTAPAAPVSDAASTASTASATQKKLSVKDFVFNKVLGQGAYARVVHAVRNDTGEEFAVKIIDKAHIQRANKAHHPFTERKALTKLRHPNIIRLYFTFQDPGSLFFVLELAPGGELFEQIRRLVTLDTNLARFYAAEIVNVIEYMHGQGVIHRDLKPENLLLDPDGHIKLIDFGTAQIDGDETTDVKEFVGTAGYVSPEVLQDQPATRASDLWALGCIIYQLLAGHAPFRATNDYLIFQKILNLEYTFPDGFPESAKGLVRGLLTLNPQDRLGYASYNDIKSHPFFEGIDFETIHLRAPPPYSLPPEEEEVDRGRGVSMAVPLEITAEEKKGLKSDDAKNDRNSKWQRFLLPSENIFFTGLVLKRKGLFAKKRQLILTDFPRFIYVDPATMEKRGEVEWSQNLAPEYKNDRTFYVRTPRRTYYFQGISSSARTWCEAINDMCNIQRVYV